MRCCRCRLILQTSLVLLIIYYFLFSGLLEAFQQEKSMEVITSTKTNTDTTTGWDEVVARMGEQLVVKRSRNKHPRILEYPSL